MALFLCAIALIYSSSSNTAKIEFWAAVGAAAGVFLFIRGFQMLQFKRMVMNTPASKVRSASMGLVEISGTAKGPSTIPAGITGEPCYYYRAIAWQLRQSGRDRQWQQVANETLYIPFFVEDPTGTLLVDPQGADLDIHRNFKDEFDTSFFSSNRDVLPENVSQFLARNGVSFTERTRIEEYCIKPDFPLFVFGTLCQNANHVSWEPVPHVGSSTSLHSQLNFIGPFRLAGSLTTGFKATTYMPSVSPAAAAQKPAAPAPSAWSEVSMDDAAMRRSGASGTKFLAAPAAVSVATAEPEPAAAQSTEFDPHPSTCIGKGGGKDPFMISWRSQREVVRSLAWKSALCIWGGPALTLVCVYILASTLGWL